MLFSVEKLLSYLDKEEERLTKEYDEAVVLRNKQPKRFEHEVKISNCQGALNEIYYVRGILKEVK